MDILFALNAVTILISIELSKLPLQINIEKETCMLKKMVLTVLAIIIILVIFIVLSKSKVDPAVYNPPKKPSMTGVLAPNNLLQKAELLGKGKLNGPEEVAVDDQGRIYAGSWEGKIVRILTDGKIETFVETGGRPLGMKFDRIGNLIVCDALKGLLSIDKNGKIMTLATTANGVSFKCTDAMDIGRNGIIYFTDASDTFALADFVLDTIEARPHGRFMSYDPVTRQVKVLMKGLCFANGVALSQNEDFALINETNRYRIWRYWLAGPKAGTSDIFIDNLPGFPDNISANRKGRFWLALYTVRNDLLDMIQPYPSIKSILGKIPPFLWAKTKRYGFVASIDEKGNITSTMQDPSGEHLYDVTSAQEYNGSLYFGSLHADRIGKIKVEK
jgi:sugar lactone lactonase YvrE